MKKTPIQELLLHLDREVNLIFLSQKDATRLKWYLEEYWFKKEKEFAHKCFTAGADYGLDLSASIEWGESGTMPTFDEFFKQYEE